MARGRLVMTADATLDASETTHTFYPPGTARNGYPVIFLHGAGLNDMLSANSGWPHGALLARVLRRAGIAVAQIYGNGTNMANDTGISRVTTALSSLAARTGCSSSKAHLIGISMGGAWATRYAALNPTKVASVNALVPLSSILNLYKQNPGQPVATGFANMVATAWARSFTVLTVTLTNGANTMVATAGSFTAAMASGNYIIVKNTGAQGSLDTTVPIGTTVASFTDATHATMSANFTGTTGSYTIAVCQPLPTSGSPNADLVSLAATILSNAIPGRLFYSSVDPYIPTADVTALATAAGWSAIQIDSTSGHADGSLAELAAYNGGTNFSELLAYLLAHGA